jgi:ABC-2 type transport system ATP-binding protein
MTVREYIEFFAKLRGVTQKKLVKRINNVIERCELEEYARVLIGKLSKGYKQRVGVAQSIVHEPDVLILDEPTVGIDPIQVTATRQLIKELGKEHTVILSTHILSEVSAICERVIIINEGKIVAEDRIENLSALLAGSKRVRLEISGPPAKIIDCLKQVSGVSRVSQKDSYYLVEYPASYDLRGKITEAISRSNLTLLALESVAFSLEDIFIKLTKEEKSKQ